MESLVFAGCAACAECGKSRSNSVPLALITVVTLSQFDSSPRRQCLHSPHGGTQHSTTWSPTASDVTPSPSSVTTPEPSWPMTSGAGTSPVSPLNVEIGMADARRGDPHAHLSSLGWCE